MRNLSIIFVMLFFGIALSAQEETVSYIMNDGSVKTYNLNDIEDISTQKGQDTYEMKIHLKNSAPVSYFYNQLDSVKFNRDNYNNYVYTVYSGAYQFSYLLTDIDSVSYYHDSVVAITNDMVLIHAGDFKMGYLEDYEDVTPITVTISKAFYMSKYEITQNQFQEVMGYNPSYFKGKNLPVEQVTWFDAVVFCNSLSLLEGRPTCYTIKGNEVTCDWDAKGYRLPTEAEWEYACRAGTNTYFYSGPRAGKSLNSADSNLDKIGWYRLNSETTTHPVGQKQPNLFGLYDMSGNVEEWCWNWEGYSWVDATDPKGETTGSRRVLRGGFFQRQALYCGSIRTESDFPNFFSNETGFRIVRVDN